MDDRHAFVVRRLGRTTGSFGLIPGLDLVATAAPEAVSWYVDEGCPAIFFPEASDPNIFAPRPELPKLYDVVFVGSRYGIRQQIAERLTAAGIGVVAYGDGWPAGRVSTDDLPQAFAQSKIVLGVGTVARSPRLTALKLRDFDGPMSGSCYLTTHNEDLSKVYEVGEEIAVYRDADDCVRVASELLLDEERRENIARRGRVRALRDHTWERRFGSLFEVILGRPTQ